MDFILDAQLFQWLYGWLHQPPWISMMSRLTHLGDYQVVMSLAYVGFLVSAAGWLKAGRKTALPLAPWLGIPAAVSVAGWLKVVVARPRPLEAIALFGAASSELRRSFPSGHATLIFALAAIFALRWPRWQVVWWVLAFGVAVSRVALGVHWPSDVIAGALISCGMVSSLSWIEQRLRVIGRSTR